MRSLYSIAVTFTTAMLVSCASGPPPQTTADLTRAHTLIASAEQGGAQQYAATDLQAARDKAQQADGIAKHDANQADRLANEASADAKLATARAQNGQAQHALAEIRQTLRTLKSEEERNTSQPIGATPSNGVPESGLPANLPPQTPSPLNQVSPNEPHPAPPNPPPPDASGNPNPPS